MKRQKVARKRSFFGLFNPISLPTTSIFGGLLILLLSLMWLLPLNAQQPSTSFNLDRNYGSLPPNIPTFREGNFELAPVFIDGKVVGFATARIGLEPNMPDAAFRAKLIHRKLQGILEKMYRYTKNYQANEGISEKKKLEAVVVEQLNITTAKLQDTFVVLIAFPQDAPPEVVFTITEADVQRVGISEEKIASESVNYGKELLLQAWKERQPDYLQSQAKFALKIFLAMITISYILFWWQKILRAQSHHLQKLLITSTNSDELINNLQTQPMTLPQPIKLALDIINVRLHKLSYRQQSSINAFLRDILLGVQILLWLLVLSYIFSLFYWSRPISNWLLGVTGWGGLAPLDWLLNLGQRATLGIPLTILILFVGISLVNKSCYILIDRLFSNWIEKKAILSASSQRYQIRGPTLANGVKDLVTVFNYFFVAIFILHQLGALPNTVTVIIGVISLGISLGAQNLIKNVINGSLILLQDWYAVGDWIAIDEFEGSVENLSLQMTQLRNLEGELITIPNGTITRVRNKSSDWSQVKFSIDVSYDADIEKTMTVMETVAQEIYSDRQWQDKLLDSPKMLGIESFENTGVKIRILLKTKPLEQWTIAREYRRRLKKAFDQSNITVGFPRHLIFVHDSSPSTGMK